MCPRERLVILSNTTSLSFAKERIGSLAAFIIIVFYLLALYLSALSKNPKNLFAKYLQRIPTPSHSPTTFAHRSSNIRCPTPHISNTTRTPYGVLVDNPTTKPVLLLMRTKRSRGHMAILSSASASYS